MAFLGTSRTMNAVNDSALSKAWKLRVANLGYCRPGRNVQLEILKLLLANHSPKAILVEVNQEEDWYGHFDFGNVVTTQEVLSSFHSKNPKFLRDVKQNFVMKFDLFQNRILNTSYATENCNWGFSNILAAGTGLNPVSFADTNSTDQRFTSLFYLKQIIDLAKQNNCSVFFHYLPTFGLSAYRPHLEDYYNQSGRLVYPPASLSNKSFWADNSHIILAGSKIYTDHLIQEISFE